MVAATYSFLDIVVLDPVRSRFAAGDTLFVLSRDLAEILWANGAGAAWLGYDDIEAALGEAPSLPAAALRQIAATPGFPAIGRDCPIALRLTRGLKSKIVNLQASSIRLPDGVEAILLALPAPKADGAVEGIQAAQAIGGFHQPGHFAALIEADGTISAATEGFGSVGIDPETLQLLVSEVREKDDRLVKKLIRAAKGKIPAGIARLTDEPARHLLVIVDEAVSEEPAAREFREEGQVITAEPEADSVASREQAPSVPGGAARTVRFSWRTDADGRFSALSEEFAATMGAPAADVIGRTFREVSNAFGLDPEGTITRLLERRDTWSGQRVMWPLSGTSLKVPVDLAALPIYGRGRVFEGFRGFGIIRPGEAVEDTEAIGTVLVPGQAEDKAPVEEEAAPPAEEPTAEDPFQGEAPAISISDSHESESEKVINLAEHREGLLSASERMAFREIGERLRRASEDVGEGGEREEPEDAPSLLSSPRQGERAVAPHVVDELAAGVLEDKAGLAGEEDGSPQEEQLPDMATRALPSGEEDKDAYSFAKPDAEESPPFFSHDSIADALPESGRKPERAEITPKQVERAWSMQVLPQKGRLPSAFFLPDDEAHEQEDATASLLTALPLPVLVHSGDRLHFANRAFLKITGYADLAALGDAGGVGALFYDAEDSGSKPESSDGEPEERIRLRRADGQDIPVRAHLSSISWKEGKSLLLALMPLGEAAVEAAKPTELEASLIEMRAIVDTATDGIVLIAEDGTIRSINRSAEALFGFDAEHVTGKPFTALFAIESQRTVQEYLAELSGDGVASVLNDGRQVIGREAQGRFIPLFITIGRLPSGSGYCAVLRDITHWKRTEEELTQARAQAERASSQKSEFLARVSHEIRTPLNAIIGFSELMIDEKFGPIGNERYRDYLRDINRSGNHVLELVNDLLDISKIEAGQQELEYEAVALNETLAQVVAMMQPQANSERVIIRSSFASRLPEVVADLRSIRQIAINLLSNAVRFTPAGGQVIVSTSYERDGSVALRVRDTGVGMSSAELDEALKPFKQVNALRRKRGDGTGLGLPLTRAMVEANRAQFSILSRPGEGTLVEVIFPPTRVLAD
ncbi:PAS domain S-box protein [Chelativorans sp. Marseille-P2723]|uniref:PAS domain S-box protein n=1 Tax=Chelativorans sp. Marseille-P2723 TaxID=2709133 RepID=UPI00156F5184|nr:PAS domain S-box protein [Chelativorans sp. Marseille-P2723]